MGIRNKKAILCFAIIILIAVLLPLSALAHSGKTDSNGGHYDSDTGEYHYHHGYPAHQHTGGKCPYDYDDKTNHSSGSGSLTTSLSTQESANVFSVVVSFVLWALIVGIIVFIAYTYVTTIKNETNRKIVTIILCLIWFIAALYLAIVNPFF